MAGKSTKIIKQNSIWKKVQHLGVKKKFKAQQIIGADALKKSFFLLLSGSIRVSFIEKNGLEKTTMYGHTDCLFNIINVLVNSTESTLITCTEESEILFFDASLLQSVDFVSEYPELATNLIKTLAVHAEALFQQCGNSSLLKSKNYLCRFLKEMIKNNTRNGITIPHYTQAEVARLLGVNRSTLTRAIIALKDENIISKFTKKELIVTDYEKLCELAESI